MQNNDFTTPRGAFRALKAMIANGDGNEKTRGGAAPNSRNAALKELKWGLVADHADSGQGDTADACSGSNLWGLRRGAR